MKFVSYYGLTGNELNFTFSGRMIKFFRDSGSNPEFSATDSWGQKYNSLFLTHILL